MKYSYIILPENVYFLEKWYIESIPKQKIKKSFATANPWYDIKKRVKINIKIKHLILFTI